MATIKGSLKILLREMTTAALSRSWPCASSNLRTGMCVDVCYCQLHGCIKLSGNSSCSSDLSASNAYCGLSTPRPAAALKCTCELSSDHTSSVICCGSTRCIFTLFECNSNWISHCSTAFVKWQPSSVNP